MNKRERYLNHLNHLKKLEKTAYRSPQPVSYENVEYIKGHAVKKAKPYYKRRYRSQYSKYLKKQSNKIVRKYKGDLHSGNHYKHCYDFWWKYL